MTFQAYDNRGKKFKQGREGIELILGTKSKFGQRLW
jgi:hypothetical protein